MAKGITILAEQRREQRMQSLKELSDRDLCEMIRTHFESHPVLPGEKVMKDQVNQILAQFDNVSHDTMQEGFVPAANTTFDDDNLMSPEEKEDLIDRFAKTRIRETRLKEGNYYLDFHHFDPTELKQEFITETADTAGNSVFVNKVNVELQRNDVGDVYVLAEQSDGGYRTIGSLPGNFLMNNPMKVDYCNAELQVSDFSNGNMKNLSATVVVDTDVMSGDVIDLDEDLLNGLDQTEGLEQ